MNSEITKNYTLAAKLTFINAFISLVSFFMDDQIPKTTIGFASLTIVVSITILFGILILRKVGWIKYGVLVFTVLGIFGMFIDSSYYFSEGNRMSLLIALLSMGLQFYTLFLMFKASGRVKS